MRSQYEVDRHLFPISITGTILVVAMVIASASGSCASENRFAYEQRSASTAPHVSIRVLNVEQMPVEETSTSGWGVKTLVETPDKNGSLRIIYVAPGSEGALVHYHEFHEWAYNIAGDFTNNESTMPDQVSGPLQRFREGYFLSRPPFSLHGGELGRQKFMASQIGATILIMEEGNVDSGTFTVDPKARNQPPSAANQYMHFNPDYAKIQHWSTPRIIDTLDKMPWQPVDDAPGLNVKYLVEDPSHGFRARMWYLEPGAKTPQALRPHFYKQAHQMNFVINGDLRIDSYSSMGKKAQTFALGTHYFVERPPMSIFGLAPEGATKGGVVWLEVTYAKGTRWTETPTPIEAPNY